MATREALIAHADAAHVGHGTHGPWEQYRLARVRPAGIWRWGVRVAERSETVLARPDGDDLVVYSNLLLMDVRCRPDHAHFVDR